MVDQLAAVLSTKTPRGYVQGYNAQAATNERQIVIAAEINTDSPDFGHLEPMVDAARGELEAAGVTETPEVVVADAGYWHQVQMENIGSPRGLVVKGVGCWPRERALCG